MTKPSEWKHITTLAGLTTEQRKQFSWNNLLHFYRVTLWDMSHTCKLCYKEIQSIDKASLDHIVPKSLGGCTRLNNLQLAHRKCNSAKSSTIERFTTDDLKRMHKLNRFTLRST